MGANDIYTPNKADLYGLGAGGPAPPQNLGDANRAGGDIYSGGQLAQQPGQPSAPPPPPGAPPPPPSPKASAASAGPTSDPFASIGGGVQLPTGEWVPKGSASDPWRGVGSNLTGTPGAPGAPSPTPAPTTPNIPTPQAAGGTTPQTPQAPDQQAQAAASQTMSATPGAAPTENTTNQGGQDILRNALISQMTSNPVPDVNDASIQAQLNPFAAAQERARRDEVRAGAESAFAGGQDYGNPEKMAAAERAGQATGLRASDLVGQELGARRQQIQQALTQFGSMISDDQRRALEKRAQDIDAQIRNKGLEQTGQLGNRELDVRDKLGMGGLNIDMMKTLNQDKQFGQDLGFRVGATQAQLNNQALTSLMNG